MAISAVAVIYGVTRMFKVGLWPAVIAHGQFAGDRSIPYYCGFRAALEFGANQSVRAIYKTLKRGG